jgi:hypothetical protein
MPDGDALYPPLQYAPFWLLLVFLILVGIVLAGWLVVFLTRPRRLASHPSADPQQVLWQLRTEYVAEIDRIEQQARDGQVSARQAHAALSRLMRGFVNEYSGLETPVMTLQDMVAQGVNPALIDALGRYTYPSLFGRGAPVDPVLGAQAARQVVQTWR